MYSEESFERALKHLQTGLDIVGENALLYAGMAHVHFHYVNAGIRPLDYLDEAEACVDKVLALEPNSSHGHRLFGLIAVLRKRFQVSVTHLKQALEVDPNDADSMFWLIQIYGISGKTEAAAVLVKRLLEIDPLTPLNRVGPAGIHLFEGRFESALAQIKEVYETDPSNPGHRYLYIQTLVYNREIERACALIDEFASDAPEHPLAMLCALLKHALQGKRSKAKKTMTPDLRAIALSDPAYSWFVAGCFALLRRNDEALEWIENAVSTGFINYPFLANHDRLLDNVRDDSRFERLLSRVKSEWERFAE
jgi:non-specific serine/threonine protein kinase